MSTFSDILRQLRTEHGFTQKEIAKHLNISPASYSLYETGKREPKYEILEEIANFFNVSVGYLVSGEKDFIYKVYKNSDAYNRLLTLFAGSASLSDELFKQQNLKQISDNVNKNLPNTLEAHFSKDEYSSEELEEIKKYAEFLKSKRKEEE